jgi:hypothetical protein
MQGAQAGCADTGASLPHFSPREPQSVFQKSKGMAQLNKHKNIRTLQIMRGDLPGNSQVASLKKIWSGLQKQKFKKPAMDHRQGKGREGKGREGKEN